MRALSIISLGGALLLGAVNGAHAGQAPAQADAATQWEQRKLEEVLEALETADFYAPNAMERPYALLEELRARSPNSPFLYAAAAELKYQLFRMGSGTSSQEVRALAQRAAQLKPDMVWPYTTLARLAASERDFASAKQLADRALQLAPNRPEAMNAQAMLALSAGMTDQAELWFLRAIEAYSNPRVKANKYYWLSTAYFGKRPPDVEKGLAAAKQAVALWPEDARKRELLAFRLLAHTDRYAEAGRQAEAALEVRPSRYASRYLAMAWYGQWALGAHADHRGAKVLSPDDIQRRTGVAPEEVFASSGALYHGQRIAEAMLRAGVIKNVDLKPSGACCTALMTAASHNKLELARMLVAKGANVNTQDSDDKTTPLYAFVTARNVEAVDFLLAKGARVNVTDARGTPLLHVAVMNDDRSTLAMTRRLLKHGADPALPDGLGENLLFAAVQFQNRELAAMLLKEYRMDPNSTDSSGNTALAVAINSMNGKGQLGCVRLLLEAGANPWVTWGAGDVLQAIDTYQEHNGQWFPDRRAIATLLREARSRVPKPAGFPEWQERQAAATR